MDIKTGQLVHPLTAMESLEKQLSCPICLDMFTKPVVILPCQHNLCRGCANDLYESRNPYHFSGGTFRCPTCRFDVVLDRHGVYGLQRNLLVENIIDIYKQQQESQGGDAEDPPLKDKDSKEPRCKEHEDERINIYCMTCQTPTCSMCKVFGQHKDCEVSPLHTVYQSQRDELRAAVEQLAAGNSCVQATMAHMEDTCRLLQENGELQRRRLGESFDLLYAIMEERKGELVEQISREEQDKLSVLRAQAERYRQQLQLSSQLQEKLQRSMQLCSVAEFLLAAKQLQDEARQAASGAQLQGPQPGYESMEHLSLDTEEVEALLSHMDFRQQGEDEDQE
ncbi:E3 ubiquitin-protein ligase TRIM63-like [Anabas testudineus]|uniref:E3 ubiquitin-protein ligase TRIM63-like n=1 Tax=Anabas testudineus TaxID=64144 RepID=UPI000F308E26|nr:E3 ubiquitin-protein ligase TRIM63-like [Anabas testudineus]